MSMCAGKVVSMVHAEWNMFLEKLKVAVHEMFSDLSVKDLRRKHTHNLLQIVTRVASVSEEDAKKVITIEMMTKLHRLKKAFGRGLKKIHQKLLKIHGEVIPEPQETDQGKRNRQKKRLQKERSVENFLYDGACPVKRAKLQN
ncbi:hypothetical protein CHS0354_021717 [Potamilus streckersoni]|uniref:Uncharacterized protein n=1 Tax=Potamilus streckersoni TaxID=2493646 RepID=A0AAE0TMM6_9BIVA|nr:hypothetical protein CHS0354_021717 [Potamilus streckersoni]